MKVDSEEDRWKKNRSKTRKKICCRRNVVHRQDFVRNKIQRLNKKKRDRILYWVEHLLQRARSICFWEEYPQRIDLVRCYFIFSSAIWKLQPTYRLQWREN